MGLDLQRARGCLLGQLTGDSLGSQVEFKSRIDILKRYPTGLRLLAVSPVWHTLPGQPTDDSELALMLARSIVAGGGYDQEAAAKAYVDWYRSKPFDVGGTTAQALGSVTDAEWREDRVAAKAIASGSRASQANGSLMRISPLGIWGVGQQFDILADHARADSRITHPHPVCQEACAVFVVAIAQAIHSRDDGTGVYTHALAWAKDHCREPSVLDALRRGESEAPVCDQSHQGWVLIALQNAFYHLLHAPNLEEGVVASAMAGGDTDTNAAIAGALLGAVYGRTAIPDQWQEAVLNCRPRAGTPNVHQPRPERFWPVDALDLADQLVGAP